MSTLYAKITNDKTVKAIGSDTRIMIDLTYKNQVVGQVGLHAIKDTTGNELGYRVAFVDYTTSAGGHIIKEVETGKTQKDTEKICQSCRKAHAHGVDDICPDDIPF